MRILLAVSDSDFSYLLLSTLKRNNYSVDSVTNKQDALNLVQGGRYDSIIIDLALSQGDETEIISSLRARDINAPIIVISDNTSASLQVRVLDIGADIFLPKPPDTEVLLANIRALTRRFHSLASSNILTFGSLSLDRSTYLLSVGDNSVRLGSREYQMFELLMSHPGQLISTKQFLDRIWGWDCDVEVNVVWVYISHLRRKLEELNAAESIRAHRGTGYSLITKDAEA